MFTPQQRRHQLGPRAKTVYSTGFPTPAASATASMLSSCSWQPTSTVIAASKSCSRRCSRGRRGAYLRRCAGSGHAGNITPPLYSLAQLLRWRCIQAKAEVESWP